MAYVHSFPFVSKSRSLCPALLQLLPLTGKFQFILPSFPFSIFSLTPSSFFFFIFCTRNHLLIPKTW